MFVARLRFFPNARVENNHSTRSIPSHSFATVRYRPLYTLALVRARFTVRHLVLNLCVYADVLPCAHRGRCRVGVKPSAVCKTAVYNANETPINVDAITCFPVGSRFPEHVCGVYVPTEPSRRSRENDGIFVHCFFFVFVFSLSNIERVTVSPSRRLIIGRPPINEDAHIHTD